MADCANCDHDETAHGSDGCFVGSALADTGQHCKCPMTYPRPSDRRCRCCGHTLGWHHTEEGGDGRCSRCEVCDGFLDGGSFWMEACPAKYLTGSQNYQCRRKEDHDGPHADGLFRWANHTPKTKEKNVSTANPDRVKAADTQVGGVLFPHGDSGAHQEQGDHQAGYGVLDLAGVDQPGIRHHEGGPGDPVRSSVGVRDLGGAAAEGLAEMDSGPHVRSPEVREPLPSADPVERGKRFPGWWGPVVRGEEASADTLQGGPRVHRGEHGVGETEGAESVPQVPDLQPGRLASMDRQVGGLHYRQTGIQPWQIWEAYGLDPWQASVIKYILRAGRKENVPAKQDYEKARHYLDYLIEREGGQ